MSSIITTNRNSIHHRADIHQHQGDAEELGLQLDPDSSRRAEGQHQKQRSMHRITRRDHAQRREDQDRGEKPEDELLKSHYVLALSILGVGRTILRNLFFVSITDRQQHRLGIKSGRRVFHRGIRRSASRRSESTGHDSSQKPQKMHFGQVDVVTRSAARAVFTLLGLDGDRQRRAHRLAQFAGDAAFFAVGITAQCVQAAGNAGSAAPSLPGIRQ